MTSAVLTLTGWVAKDPAERKMGDKNVVEITLSVSVWAGREQTDWYKVQFWGKAGEQALEKIKKGARIQVFGKQRIEKWTNKDNVEMTQPTVSATEFVLIAKSKDEAREQAAAPASTPRGRQAQQTDDDLPF